MKLVMFIIHGVISIALVVSVLFQMSKYSELGGAFGSGSLYTVFGREKGLDTMGKITLGLAIAFMVTSFLTAYVLSL
ncbi:MAG TPA: preprotein translocase subunit SecG [Thermotogales bacterium]|nr:preprotein translocase subunit SecG [Thermotogales bacterium]